MFILDLTPFWNVTWFCEEKVPFSLFSTHGYLIRSSPWFFLFTYVFSFAPGSKCVLEGVDVMFILGSVPFWNVTYFLLTKHPFRPVLDTRLPNILLPQYLLLFLLRYVLSLRESRLKKGSLSIKQVNLRHLLDTRFYEPKLNLNFGRNLLRI